MMLGLTGVALFFSLQNLGLVFTSAGNSSLIMGGAPAAITVMAILVLREQPSREQVSGVILTTIGIVFVSLAGVREGFGKAPVVGSLFLSGAIVTWGIYTILGKRIAGEESSLQITVSSIGAGLMLLIIPAALEIWFTGFPVFSLSSLIAVFYLGAIGSGLTLFLYNYALRFMDASAAAPFINLTPVIGVIFASISGEKTGILQIVGGAVVLFGVWLSNKQSASRPRTFLRDH